MNHKCSSWLRRLSVAVLALAILFGYWLVTHPRGDSRLPPSSLSAQAGSDNDGLQELRPNDTSVEAQFPVEAQSAIRTSPNAASTVICIEPSPITRELVARLSTLDLSSGRVTQEGMTDWTESFQQLVQHGAAAVPAIREFLAKNADFDFGPSGWRMLGYPSARAALFEALAQIGGSEALALTLDTLRTTAAPREIALLARNLEKMSAEEPQYPEEAVQAARETLEMAASGRLEDRDVAPLFEVLNKYGAGATVQDLEQASKQWNYYAVIALAQLPDGAGVPSLIRMAQEQRGYGPLQVLAQLASEYPDARAALLEQARLNQIPASAWPYLQSVLAGHRFHFVDSFFDESAATASRSDLQVVHIAYGNQNYYMETDATRLSPEQINEQMGLIEELLAVAQDPAAAQALRGAPP